MVIQSFHLFLTIPGFVRLTFLSVLPLSQVQPVQRTQIFLDGMARQAHGHVDSTRFQASKAYSFELFWSVRPLETEYRPFNARSHKTTSKFQTVVSSERCFVCSQATGSWHRAKVEAKPSTISSSSGDGACLKTTRRRRSVWFLSSVNFCQWIYLSRNQKNLL